MPTSMAKISPLSIFTPADKSAAATFCELIYSRGKGIAACAVQERLLISVNLTLTTPQSVSTVTELFFTSAYFFAKNAAHLTPLPHIAPREPSALYITIFISARAELSIAIIPSLPMPNLLSLAKSANFFNSSSVLNGLKK